LGLASQELLLQNATAENSMIDPTAREVHISEAIAAFDRIAPDPRSGLPDEVFYYISRTTPLVNLDLLIKDERGRTLLAWRTDRFCGTGWHVPGGIVRFKESFEERARKIAVMEIGTALKIDMTPIAVSEIITPTSECDMRGHFISILLRSYLTSSFVPTNLSMSANDPGYLKWHNECPDNLIEPQEVYRNLI